MKHRRYFHPHCLVFSSSWSSSSRSSSGSSSSSEKARHYLGNFFGRSSIIYRIYKMADMGFCELQYTQGILYTSCHFASPPGPHLVKYITLGARSGQMLIYDIVLSINFSFFPLGYFSNLSIFQKHNLAKISLFGRRPNIYEYGDFAVCQDPIQSIEGAMLAKVESWFLEVLSIMKN